MNKKLTSLLITIILLIPALFSNGNEYLINVPENYRGAYLPVSMMDIFEATLNFEEAKRSVPLEAHDVLMVYDDICWSNKDFQAGYKIKAEEFNKFSFFKNENETFLVDSKNFVYKRCHTNSKYDGIRRYLDSHIFNCVQDLKNVEIYGLNLKIEDGYIYIDFNSLPNDKSNVLCYVKEGAAAIKTNGISGGIYRVVTSQDGKNSYVSNEELYHFPLLSYTPLIPLEDMSASELRLYRNLQLARHGYNFDSRDLQEIFEKFEWYKPVKDNREVRLSEDELAIVSKCLELEKNNVNTPVSLRNYLQNFFNGKKYNVTVFTEYNTPLFIARSVIDDEKNICDKACVYKLENGYVKELLKFIDNKVLDKQKTLFKGTDSKDFYGWNIEIKKTEYNNPNVFVTSYINKGKDVADTVEFSTNVYGKFQYSPKTR